MTASERRQPHCPACVTDFETAADFRAHLDQCRRNDPPDVEVWRQIVGFSGYFVSSQGRVASEQRGTRRILTGGYAGSGYRKVAMTADNGHRYGKKVHQLVAEAFLGPRPPGAEVCHRDDVKSNNATTNLRWDTRSANILDSVRNGLHANARKTHCPRRHPYSEANTYITRRGQRMCRTCARSRTQGAAA